jgi:hypothetical protein
VFGRINHRFHWGDVQILPDFRTLCRHGELFQGELLMLNFGQFVAFFPIVSENDFRIWNPCLISRRLKSRVPGNVQEILSAFFPKVHIFSRYFGVIAGTLLAI